VKIPNKTGQVVDSVRKVNELNARCKREAGLAQRPRTPKDTRGCFHTTPMTLSVVKAEKAALRNCY